MESLLITGGTVLTMGKPGVIENGAVYIEEHTDYFVTTLPGPPSASGCASPEVYLVTAIVSDGLAESSTSRYIEVYNSGCHVP